MHWQLAGKHDLRPSYIAAGVGGGITGEGASVLIIDDPLKNAAEASSDTIRESIWQWYITTAITRLEPDGAKIVIMTRWHDDDLAGRLLKVAQKDPKADQWTVLHLKAINEKGEALWPEKFPLEYLEKVRAGQIDDPEQPGKGSRAFASLYQGEPSIAEGNILHRGWWKFYRQAPARFDRVIQSWDCTFKDTLGTDFVVGQVWGQLGADKYLLDQIRDRMDFTSTVNAILTLSAKWPQSRAKLIEDKANGPAVIATLKRKVSGLIPIEPEEIGNKVARAWGVSPDIEAGNVWLPEGLPWVHDFVEECASFPNGAFDDQVDAMSQALNYLSEEAPKDQVVVYDSMQLVKGIEL
jgi:predicted phage terminase large subunit-like protein